MNPARKVLCLNIGNSATKFALFDSKNMLLKDSLPTCSLDESKLASLVSFHKAQAVIACSVVKDKNSAILDLNRIEGINAIAVVHSMITRIKSKYVPPESIGIDRLLFTSYCYFKSRVPVILFDFGTATTATIINADGELIGGAIMPGIMTQLKSLAENTSLLPETELSDSKGFVADNTKDAMTSGVLANTTFFALNYPKYARSRHSLKNVHVFLTGGFADTVHKHILPHDFDFPLIFDEDIGLKSLICLYSRISSS